MVGLNIKPPICADLLVTWYELTFTVARKVILNLSFNTVEPSLRPHIQTTKISVKLGESHLCKSWVWGLAPKYSD